MSPIVREAWLEDELTECPALTCKLSIHCIECMRCSYHCSCDCEVGE